MLRILDPTTAEAKGKFVMAIRRHHTLKRLKIGVLWNGRPFGGKILPKVVELLKEKYSIEVIDYLEKKFIGNIAPKEFFEKLVADKADAVLVGVGD